MSRTPARFTQADVARAIRAAKQTGAGEITVAKDGSIVIRLSPTGQAGAKDLDEDTLIRL
jgi:hypothetical protein